MNAQVKAYLTVLKPFNSVHKQKVEIRLDYNTQMMHNLPMLFVIKNASDGKDGYIIYVHGLRALIGTKGRTLEPEFIPLMSTIYIQVMVTKG